MRKYITVGIISFTTLGVISLFFVGGGKTQKTQRTTATAANNVYPTERLASWRGASVIDDIQKGRIDLALEFARIKSECIKAHIEAVACNERTRAIIRSLPDKDRNRLLDLFDEYLGVEDKITQKKNLPQNFESLSEMEKYRTVKNLRKEALGDTNAKLLFGLQEARIALAEEQTKFTAPEYARLTGDERVRLYEDRKREILGSYYEVAAAREPTENKVAVELALRQDANTNTADDEQLLRDLKVKYFGEAETERMEAEEAEEKQTIANEAAKMDRFLAAEQEYLTQNAHLTEDERRAGVEALRESILGKDTTW